MHRTCLRCEGTVLQALHAVQKPAVGFHGRDEHGGLAHAPIALATGPACIQTFPSHDCQ